jgi:hypothetical protein
MNGGALLCRRVFIRSCASPAKAVAPRAGYRTARPENPERCWRDRLPALNTRSRIRSSYHAAPRWRSARRGGSGARRAARPRSGGIRRAPSGRSSAGSSSSGPIGGARARPDAPGASAPSRATGVHGASEARGEELGCEVQRVAHGPILSRFSPKRALIRLHQGGAGPGD